MQTNSQDAFLTNQSQIPYLSVLLGIFFRGVRQTNDFYKFAGVTQRPLIPIIITEMSMNKRKNLPTIKLGQTTLNTYVKSAESQHSAKDPEPNELFKKSQTFNQSTNCFTNAQYEFGDKESEVDEDNSNARGFHQAQDLRNEMMRMRKVKEVEDCNEAAKDCRRGKGMIKRVTVPPCEEQSNTLPVKMQVVSQNFDSVITLNKIHYDKMKSTIKAEHLAETSKKQNINKQVQYDLVADKIKEGDLASMFEIPPNKKVEKIMTSCPLRQKFNHLLDWQNKFDIGYENRYLLSILKAIDLYISFLRMKSSQNQKFSFFSSLKKHLRDSSRVQVTQKHIQQLLFLDDELFSIEWAYYQNIKDHDLKITLPRVLSEDKRISETRGKIVEYLMTMQINYMENNNLTTNPHADRWIDGFNPERYQIPIKLLPTHPFYQKTSVRSMTRDEINKVPSEAMKRLFHRKKDEAQAQSMVSDDIVSMVLSKQKNESIKDRLYRAIEEKEKIIRQKQCGEFPLIDNETLLSVLDQIILTYSGKGVSNIPKSVLIDIIDRKSTLKVPQIVECLKAILSVVEIKFLKEVTTRDKMVIIQMDRSKYSEMREHAKTMKLQ